MPISQVARRKGGYTFLDPETQQKVLDSYQTNVIQTQRDIARELKGSNQTLVWDSDDQRFEVIRNSPISTTVPRHKFRGGPTLTVATLVAPRDMEYLNEVLLGLQKNDPLFRQHGNIDSIDEWGKALADNVNGMVTPVLEPQPLKGPDGQELTKQQPGFFTDDQGNIFQGTKAGEFKQVGGAIIRDLIPTDLKMPKFPAKRKKEADLIISESQARGIDPRLMIAIAIVESQLNPKAANNKADPGVADDEKGVTSALGVFQNVKDNFAQFGPDDGDPFKLEDQIEAGMNFMEFLQERFPGDLDGILAHWHGGQNKRTIDDADIAFVDLVRKQLSL